MKRNVGTVDTIIRVVIALVIALLYLTDVIGGVLAIILGIIALALLVTGLIGCCALYMPFGINTSKTKTTETQEGATP